jgi:hypothetical protein
MNKYRTLNKDMTRLRERKKVNEERKQIVMNVAAQLLHRRRQLISDLNQIFPIVEVRLSPCFIYLLFRMRYVPIIIRKEEVDHVRFLSNHN